MFVSLFLSNSYLRKNKVQNIFILLLIFLSTLLIATSIVIISNTGNQFTKMHHSTNAAHQIITLENNIHDANEVHQWWSHQKDVQVSHLLEYYMLSGITHNNEDFPNVYMYMINTPAAPLVVDNLLVEDNQSSSYPDRGTVWIPSSLANSFNIKLNDSLEFNMGEEKESFKVSSIVIDVPYGAPFTNTSRVWMNSNDYQDQFTVNQNSKQYMMGLRFEDYSKQQTYWNQFTQHLGTPFLENLMDYNAISSFYLIINQIVGFIMAFLGIIMVIIALITLCFTISDAIITNYKTIGILKSIGLTTSKKIMTYVFQYSVLSLIAIVPALIVSQFMSKIIIDLSVSSLKVEGINVAVENGSSAIVVGLVLLLLINLFVYIYTRKIRNIEPVQAIRFGMSEEESNHKNQKMKLFKLSPTVLKYIPLSIMLGIRNLLKNLNSSFLILVLTMIASSVLVFGGVVLSSINNIQNNAAQWGYDNATISAVVVNKSLLNKAQFEKTLLSDKRLKNMGWMSNLTGIIHKSLVLDNNEPILNVSLNVLDGNYDSLGFETLRGSNPIKKNEISIGVGVANTLNKDIGDNIDIYIQGEKQSLQISGIYQSIANMSMSARILFDTVREVDNTYNETDVAYINLYEPSLADEFVDTYYHQYHQAISIVTQKTLLDSVYGEVSTILTIPMGFLGLLFLIVTFIIIFSTCRINIKKESKNYGIIKSLGLTSLRIRSSLTITILLLSVLGALIGIIIGVYLLPFLLEYLLVGYGIVNLPIEYDLLQVVLLSFISVIFVSAGAWTSSKVIHDTSPRMLVIE